MRSNLGSNFFEQTHIYDTKTESETMNNMSILRWITNVFLLNLPITYACGDNKNDCYSLVLVSAVYIELIDPNIYPIDLLYPSRQLLFVEFVYASIFVSNSYFPIETTSITQGVTTSHVNTTGQQN
jgi:hypothetical protein